MSDQHPAADLIVSPGAIEAVAALQPSGVFGLIAWTAETIRWLQQENERIAGLEQEARTMLEHDRALWRADLEIARTAAETHLARATAAERDALDARTKAQLAVRICKETHAREQAATARAEAAEERARVAEDWRKRFSWTSNVVPLIDRRP